MNDRVPVDYRIVRAHLAASVAFLLLAIFAGLLYSLQFIGRYPFPGVEFLSPGRLRMVHTNAIGYGWLINGLIASAYWIVPRLTGYPVLSKGLSRLIFWTYQIAITASLAGILYGMAQGVEWGETPIFADPVITLGLILLAVNILPPIFKGSSEAPLYVSLWYTIGALVWIVLVYIMGNYMVQFFVPGSGGAAIAGNFIHDFVGLFVTPLGWAMMYFFVPVIIKRPIWSHSMSLMGFWGLAFFYPMQGIHHFMWSPVPMYVQYSAVVATIGIEVVVTTILVNFVLTLRGSGGLLVSNYPVRWFYTGIILYAVTCLQCAVQVTLTVQKAIHFTDWVIGHSHLVMFGVFSFWIIGMITEIWPRLTGNRWYSDRLHGWAWWLSTLGLVVMFVDLVIAGLVQGFSWWSLAHFMDSVRFSVPFWFVRTLSGLMIMAGVLAFVYNMFMTHLGRVRARETGIGRGAQTLIERGAKHGA